MQLARPGGFLAVVLISLRGVLGAGSLEEDVQGFISKHGFQGSEVAVAILDDSGKAVASINAERPFKPASNLKILTTAAALHLLGPGHKYVTSLSASAPLADGRIAGDLLVRGTGDPNISSRFYDGGPGTLFRQWARELREKGLRRVTGGIVADDTFFDDVRIPPSWDPRQAETWYSAQISALTLNDNCLDVIVKPATQPGKPARVEIVPACSLIEVEGAPETVAGGSSRVIVHRKTGTNRISVKGQIGQKSPAWTGNVTFDDPTLVFASTLAQALKDEGITLEGAVRKLPRSGRGEARAAAPQGSALLVEHSSTLIQDLSVILKHSQNLHAEVLLKVLGASKGGEGSLEGGDLAIRQFLRAVRIPDRGLVLADGSGLSHENRVTADLLVRVLHSVRAEKYFDDYLKALPIAGKDGTLEERFQNRAVRGHLHAKTGYIKGVSCLSGYVVRESRVASFSILVNRATGGIGGAKALEEEIGDRIYRTLGK